MTIDPDIQKTFFNDIKINYPDFSHTNALYLDFESTKMLNLFWPQKAGIERFEYLSAKNPPLLMNDNGLSYALEKFGINNESLAWIVVFSGQRNDEIAEKLNFENLFSDNFFPNAEWIDLHRFLKENADLKRYIRERQFSRRINRENVPYNLENLEESFGIRRPLELCSHNNLVDGIQGEMYILEFISKWESGVAEDYEINNILKYCRFDVESLFKILRKGYKLNKALH